MRSFLEAKAAAEKSGTDKSQKFRPAGKKFFIILTAVVLLGASVYFWERTAPQRQQTPQHATITMRAAIPVTSSSQSSWPKLTLPPMGRSELVAVPPQMHIVVIGNNFRVHNVYKDGHECAFGEACVAGPLSGNYVTNEAGGTNIVSYAFAPD